MRKETYETPLFESIRVEMEEGIMLKASTFEPGDETTQQGLSIEEHGFATPGEGVEWEGDYTGPDGGWDKN